VPIVGKFVRSNPCDREVITVFEKFNQVPLIRLYPLVDMMRVELLDLRFGTLKQAGFAATALVRPDGRVATVDFGFGR